MAPYRVRRSSAAAALFRGQPRYSNPYSRWNPIRSGIAQRLAYRARVRAMMAARRSRNMRRMKKPRWQVLRETGVWRQR